METSKFFEALEHDHNCPCELCKEFWTEVDPNGDYVRDERDEPAKLTS